MSVDAQNQSPGSGLRLAPLAGLVTFLVGAGVLLVTGAFFYAILMRQPLFAPGYFPTAVLILCYYVCNGFLLCIFLYLLLCLLLLVSQLVPEVSFLFYQSAVVLVLLQCLIFRVRINWGWLHTGALPLVISDKLWRYDVAIFSAMMLFSALFMLLPGMNSSNTYSVYLYSTLSLIVALLALNFALRRHAAHGALRSDVVDRWVSGRIIDAQITDYLARRWLGLILIFTTYAFVIVSFSTIYYYIDHCSEEHFPCTFVDSSLLRQDDDATARGWKNFNVNPAETWFDVDRSTGRVYGGEVGRLKVFLPYLYFSVVTSTTVGYGDIFPVSITAVWLVIVHHFISIILLIGFAGQVAGFSVEESQANRPP
jgi:hypothetical protein